MGTRLRIGVLALFTLFGCEESEDPIDPELPDAAATPLPREDRFEDAGSSARRDAGSAVDASAVPASDAAAPFEADAAAPEEADADLPTDVSATPAELIGSWNDGSLDFETWENYRERQWAGKYAAPTREAMVFRADGSAKFYRYEALFNFYEELIDCEGVVAFHDDGSFTFTPHSGRRRFHDFSYAARNLDRPLNDEELASADLAGTRAYRYDASTDTLEIRVPSSAPYKWYRAE